MDLILQRGGGKHPLAQCCTGSKKPSAFRVKEELRVETQASWEKFCNSISLETDQIKNFLKSKGQCNYPTLQPRRQSRQNKRQQSATLASVERHFGIGSEHFDLNHFNEVNKFIEDNHKYFYPPEDPDDYRFYVGNEHELVEDVDAQTPITGRLTNRFCNQKRPLHVWGGGEGFCPGRFFCQK